VMPSSITGRYGAPAPKAPQVDRRVPIFSAIKHRPAGEEPGARGQRRHARESVTLVDRQAAKDRTSTSRGRHCAPRGWRRDGDYHTRSL